MAYIYGTQLQVDLGDGVWISCGVQDTQEALRICRECGWKVVRLS